MNLMETDFISNNINNNNDKNITDISNNNQLNFIYNIIKLLK